MKHSPKALTYYQEQLALSLEALSAKSGIALNTLVKACEGETVFSLLQIKKLSNVLLVPDFALITDYVENFDIPETIDHRNLSSDEAEENQYQLIKTLRQIINHRDDLLYTFESMGDNPEVFDLKLTGDDSTEDAQRIRDFLEVDSNTPRVNGNDDYYKDWRLLVERKDIMVMEIARTAIGSEGMALYYPTLPIIAVLSTGQSHSRRLFTLIHELVHLGLRQSSIDGALLEPHEGIERYCNRVAGSVLVPDSVIANIYDCSLSLGENVDAIRKFQKVSRQAIAIQLNFKGLVTKKELNAYFRFLEEKYASKGGGGNNTKPVISYNKFGKVFVQQVISAVWGHDMPVTTAMKILNVKDIGQFHSLETMAFKDNKTRTSA